VNDATLACPACDPPGILWVFKRGEDRSDPQCGQWYECPDCDGTGRIPNPDFEPEEIDV
jgi:hypothetical protein